MQQDMILIIDLGSEGNAVLAREIRKLGVYSEIHPHDLTEEQLKKLPNVKGIILNGGKNNVIDGVKIDASEAIYSAGLPILTVNTKESLESLNLKNGLKMRMRSFHRFHHSYLKNAVLRRTGMQRTS